MRGKLTSASLLLLLLLRDPHLCLQLHSILTLSLSFFLQRGCAVVGAQARQAVVVLPCGLGDTFHPLLLLAMSCVGRELSIVARLLLLPLGGGVCFHEADGGHVVVVALVVVVVVVLLVVWHSAWRRWGHGRVEPPLLLLLLLLHVGRGLRGSSAGRLLVPSKGISVSGRVAMAHVMREHRPWSAVSSKVWPGLRSVSFARRGFDVILLG